MFSIIRRPNVRLREFNFYSRCNTRDESIHPLCWRNAKPIKTESIFKLILRYKAAPLELEPNNFRAWKNNGVVRRECAFSTRSLMENLFCHWQFNILLIIFKVLCFTNNFHCSWKDVAGILLSSASRFITYVIIDFYTAGMSISDFEILPIRSWRYKNFISSGLV